MALEIADTVTQTIETIRPGSTVIGIRGTSANGATATVSANSVEASVLFNAAQQTAAGAPQSGSTGVPASVALTATTFTATGPTVDVSSAIGVLTSQANAGISGAAAPPSTGALAPVAAVYNTNITTTLTGAATNNTTAETSTNSVAALLAGNVSANIIRIEGDETANFSGGLASATVQTNRNTAAVLGTLVSTTDIGILLQDTAGTTRYGFDGTALVFGNTVNSSANGNSATTSITNTLATRLGGNYQQTAAAGVRAPVVAITPTTTSVLGDVVAVTAQENSALQLLAQTTATRIAVAADNVTGLAAVDSNAVRANATLNSATSNITAVGGTGVTTTSLIAQNNFGNAYVSGLPVPPPTLFSAAQAAVTDTRILAETIRTDSGSTVSVVGNQVGSDVTFSTAAQTAGVSTTVSPVLQGTERVAGHASLTASATQLNVAAQVSLTSLQNNQLVNTTLPLQQAAALTSNTRVYAVLSAPSGEPALAAMTTTVGSNAVTASVMGNQVSNTLAFGGEAATEVAGASIFAGQTNLAPGNMTARATGTLVGVSVLGDFLGTASVDQNRIASSSVGNSSVNEMSSALGTALAGGGVPLTNNQVVLRAIPLGTPGNLFEVTGYYVVGNTQNNLGTAVVAETNGSDVAILASGGFTPGSVGSVSANRVLATATLNEAQNSLSLAQASDSVGSVTNAQLNGAMPGTTPVPSSATATVTGTNVVAEFGFTGRNTAPGTTGTLGTSTVLVDRNTVQALASANVATNTVRQGGPSIGGTGPVVIAGDANTASLNGAGDLLAATGDYVTANLQGNDGVAVAATVGVTNLRATAGGNVTTSVASASGNQVLATGRLNDAQNGLTLIGGNGLIGTLANFQFNNGASSASAEVSDATISVSGAAATTSTLLVDRNTVRALSSGNTVANTVSNGGLTTGSSIGPATATVEAMSGPTTVVRADYSIANRQQNIGTEGTPFSVSSRVLNANLAINAGLTTSVAQMTGNTVLASAMGNQAVNRMALTGSFSSSLAEMSQQENRFASISASVQGARIGVSSGSTTGSSAFISSNAIGAQATGNMLTSVIGR